MINITAIVCTYNEELHIERCIKSLKKICNQIIVVDSFSNDSTAEISKKLGAEVYYKKYITFSEKLNYAIKNYKIKGDWVLRIDADEFMDEELLTNLKNLNDLKSNVTGLRIARKIKFLGKELMHSGMYPIFHLKIWKKGHAFCEERWMDERMVLTNGNVITVAGNIIDDNKNSLSSWSSKHSVYASKEAADYFQIKYNLLSDQKINHSLFGTSEERRRFFKMVYLKTPLFVRPFVFFVIRYFFQLGFLEGYRGLIWNILQGFWYRFLVDSIIYDCNKNCKNKQQVLNYFNSKFNIQILNNDN
jgi:glycosyltransferase involved in cell wall biosynthesis